MKAMMLDGGFGTMIQAAGLPVGKDPTDWNLEKPEAVIAVHRAYVEAGSQVVLSNTFGANRLKYHGEHKLEELIEAALRNARASGAEKVALDIGPTGKLLKPAGDLEFEEAVKAFGEMIRAAKDKAELIFIETMSDLYELKAAVIAAKENSELPIYASVSLQEDGRLLTGGSIEAYSALMESLGVEAYGFNCGLGPDKMLPYVKRLAELSSRPIIAKPNAGMPRLVDGKTVFEVGPKEFASEVGKILEAGATIVGGCCGTTAEHIAALKGECGAANGVKHGKTIVSSGVMAIEIKPYQGTIIGERINPTGKKLLKEAYAKGDTAYILREAVKQVDAGAEILDVNCGVPGLDEAALLESTVVNVQSVAACPIQIDTADGKALERAIRLVNGKALVNSVNGRRESMDSVFPVVQKYGGVIVGLCLDEHGIPNDAEGRIEIARKILSEGEKYGFTKADFVFDALTLAVSTDAKAAKVTLETVKRLTEELGVNTVLGVSNVSFGLPNRPALNNAMYVLAKRAGLSAAIANPSVIRDEIDPAAEAVLMGEDHNAEKWIAMNAEVIAKGQVVEAGDTIDGLKAAISAGLKDDAGSRAKGLMAAGSLPMEIVDKAIVPALETIGKGFETGKVFLPQLLMSADAAGEAFAVIRAKLSVGTATTGRGGRPVVIATVKGDVHDIGKNIVRALLENYGFEVIDLGRDVAPEKIVETAKRENAFLVGLSALMTTTVGAMEETIRQLKMSGAEAKVVVGGAVVTQEYADSIGADFYAKDAMRTVRIAENML